ncbi:bifunctional lysylphosphatidylglycerol flippase/synthetase MprF [Paenibacillus pinistramenti]|uniref:bifunctional lysylphosphatidylglycerol flippase/synthetase MprF n=1 Tax=Paenibacillus pinistramenti TaxID=1768003 RepID=UPI0011098E79|nr:bifunctional lysylphosphatidylglycerol flippase/synthetase MprF [Paenibacillus pinistramenti]
MKEKLARLRLVRLLIAALKTKAVRILIPVVIFGLVIWAGQHELKKVRLGVMLAELRRIPAGAIAEIFVLALAAVAVMSCYDFVIRRQFRFRVSPGRTFRYSWIANTFNNLLGFAGLTGAGVRALLYKKSGVPASSITAAAVFLSPVVLNGLSVMAWLEIFGVFQAKTLLHEHRWMNLAVWAIALYLPLFIALQRTRLFAKWFHKQGKELFPWRTILEAVGASFVEWLFAGLTFSLIANHVLDGGVGWRELLGMYTVAAVGGILSMAPGGVGAFDLTVLLGLKHMGFPAERALAVIVLFRFFYYIIPWCIGLILAILELGFGGRKPGEEEERQLLEVPLTYWQKLWGWPGQFRFLSDLGVWALGKLVLLSGLVLLLSAATPGLLYRIRLTEDLLTMPVMHLSHQLSVIIGFALVILSRGITLRVRQAYVWTRIMLLAGAVFTFTKAFDYEEAVFLLLVALMLWISRDRFYRAGTPVIRRSVVLWLAITLVLAFIYYWLGSHIHNGFFRHLHLKEPLIGRMTARAYAVNTVVGLAGAWLLLILIFSLRPGRLPANRATPEELARVQAFLQENSGNLLTHMLFAGDKSFYWAQEGRVLFPYAKVRDKLVVLGDPLGQMELVSAGIAEFQRFADLYGMLVVFYQVTPEYLPIYHENGCRFFKLGEEALIPLNAFTLAGKKHADLRSIKNRFDREGYTFEVVSPPHSGPLLEELRAVSMAWLKGRQEKGFSLGWFDPAYMQQSPIGLLKDGGGRVTAFASLAPAYDGGKTVSIDLMRHTPHAPNGTMDYLFTRLLEWAKDSGYERFSLGNAPLSRVGQKERALREERLAGLVFQHGGHWYGFKGLRKYKEKFAPHWESRYLAYPANIYLPVLTLDLVRLVSRKVKP